MYNFLMVSNEIRRMIRVLDGVAMASHSDISDTSDTGVTQLTLVLVVFVSGKSRRLVCFNHQFNFERLY